MGCWDGAETFEVDGLYPLHLLDQSGIRNCGLYHVDGLRINYSKSWKNVRDKKTTNKTFAKQGLQVEIECNQITVDYLDLTLDLSRGGYKPYCKQNASIRYVNIQSDHSKHIQEQMPQSIKRRLFQLSENEEQFQEAIGRYQAALSNAGYKHT